MLARNQSPVSLALIALAALAIFSGIIAGIAVGAADRGALDLAPGGVNAQRTVFDVVAADATLADFAFLLQEAGLANRLRGDGPFTLVAPDQEAFNKLTPEERANFFEPNSPATLRLFMEFLVINALLPESELRQAEQITGLGGRAMQVSTNGDDITLTFAFREARVIRTDTFGTNGVVHVIDTVLGI